MTAHGLTGPIRWPGGVLEFRFSAPFSDRWTVKESALWRGVRVMQEITPDAETRATLPAYEELLTHGGWRVIRKFEGLADPEVGSYFLEDFSYRWRLFLSPHGGPATWEECLEIGRACEYAGVIVEEEGYRAMRAGTLAIVEAIREVAERVR